MTFDEFFESVERDLAMGGITPGQAYMRALNRHLPELVDRFKDDPHLNPATDLANLHLFLLLVRSELRKQPQEFKVVHGQVESVVRISPPKEGWGAIRPGDRKAHYYRDGMSLCRRVGFYSGPLEPDAGTSKDDHAECRKLLDKEKAKVPA